jgi:RNA polymerase sigma-H factor
VALPQSIDYEQQLIDQAQHDPDSPAWPQLLTRYNALLHALSRHYLWRRQEMDDQDVQQILYIALWQAVMHYDSQKGVPFEAWLRIVVKRQLVTAFRTMMRNGRQFYAQAWHLEDPIRIDHDHQDQTWHDIVADPQQLDPSTIIEQTENLEDWFFRLAPYLSDFEWHVLWAYTSGHNYDRIAAQHHTNSKSIDNALQRIRRKCRQFLHDRTADTSW